MTVSNNFFKLLIDFEGFVSCPYKDQVGIPTVGIGTTTYPDGRKVTIQDSCITLDIAKIYVLHHITSIQNLLNAELPMLNQNQFDALVSFIYNIGEGAFRSSTLLKKAKVDINDSSIRAEFNKWNKAGGKVIPGLTKRRKQEADLYFKAV
jgi:lysozyme